MQLIFIIRDHYLSDYGSIIGSYSTKELAHIGVQKYLESLTDDARLYLGGEKLAQELERIKKMKKEFLPIIANYKPCIGRNSSACWLSIEVMPLYNSIQDFYIGSKEDI